MDGLTRNKKVDRCWQSTQEWRRVGQLMIEKGKYNEKAANEGKTIETYTQRDTTMDFADYKGKDRRLGPERVNYVPQIT